MAWYDFIKDAGEKLFSDDKAESAAIEKHIKKHQLKGKVNVAVAGDTATITGTSPNQAELEKIILASGNVEGIAKVSSEVQVSQPADEAKMHTVVRGDNLSKIAKKYYGKSSKYPVIYKANRPMLNHPDKIYPGQVLRIPPLG